MIEKTEFYIDGAWQAPARRPHASGHQPVHRRGLRVISLGGQADTDAAVAAARAAFPGWMATPVEDRIAYVEKILEVYKTRGEDLAQAISAEMGAPIHLARQSQVGAGIFHITNFLKAAREFEFDAPLGDHAPNDRIIHEPVGVVGMITPWNWPMNQITLKVIAGWSRAAPWC